MNKITTNFSREEFDCKDGTPYPSDWIASRLKPLCDALEIIRASRGKVMTVNSGYRTPEYNKKIGGAVRSKHMEGIACDIKLEGMGVKKLYELIDRLQRANIIPRGGLGLYSSFVHYDTRGHIARF